MGVRIELLGPVRAWRDGEPVALRGVSARTVLACLALRLGSVVSAGELGEALWGEDPPDGATANLQSTVSRLRRGLGPGVIESAPRGYRLDREQARTDLADIEDLVADTASRAPADVADDLASALQAWEGEPLADVAATEWFLPDRSRLTELRLALRDRWSELLIAADRANAALVELQAAAVETPMREPTHLLLAEALHRLGRDAEGLRALDTYRRTLAEETGLDPSPAVTELEQRMLTGDALSSRRASAQWQARQWIPPETPFVGRDHELTTCEHLVERHRLVTIIGTGGVGKSRLAMELVRRRDAGSVVVVRLAPLAAQAPVATSLAAELGLEATGDSLLDAVVDRLAQMPTGLVVLDNCEHVLPETQALVDELLRRVGDLRVLATSRQRLGLAEEQVLLLEALPVPDEADNEAPVVRLLVDRIARSAPDLELDGTADAAVLTDICRLLDGLPLALELAAARAHLLGLGELRAQLTRGRVPAPSGGRTMEGAVSWSLGLLGPPAQGLFADLCVFPDAFDLDTVRAVAVSDDDEATVALAELVDASLVAVSANDGRRRYRILAPIRQVGAAEVPERAVEAYLDWVIGLGERARACFIGWEPRAASDILADHHDDFRHALTILAARADHGRFDRLASRLSTPLYRRPDPELVGLILEHSAASPDGLLALVDLESGVGLPERCITHLERLLDLVPADDPRVPRALVWSCPAFASMGDLGAMIDSAKRVVEHPATTDYERVTGVGMWALGETYHGRTDVADRILTDHADLLRLGAMAFTAFVRAEMAASTDPDRALAWLEEGAAQARHDGDTLMGRMIDVAHFALLVREEHDDVACRLARELIPELLAAVMTPQAWMSLRHVATLLTRLGEPGVALEILDGAAASPQATALVGEAIEADSALRREIEDRLRATGNRMVPRTAPRLAGELWIDVDEVLQHVTATPMLRLLRGEAHG